MTDLPHLIERRESGAGHIDDRIVEAVARARCVNPDHLFLGTKKDNADDRDRKGRNIKAPTRRGSNASGAKLTDAQVAEIRASELPSVRLAPLYNVCDSHIRALRRGECFADLSLLPPAPKASP